MDTLEKFSELANDLIAERNHLVASVAEDRAELKKCRQSAEDAVIAQKIIQLAAQQIQQAAHSQICSVVSRCLSAIFDDPYEFRIEFERKRGKTEARLVFIKDGEEYEPLDASGGGVVDVAAFALRVACLVFSSHNYRRTIILDEPFRFVHGDLYRERVRTMLEKLAEDLGVQFIMVTGMEELKTGKVIALGR